MADTTTTEKKKWLGTSMDLLAAMHTAPPPQDFVIPGLLIGTVALLYSPGGVGKSWFALEVCTGVASSKPDANLLGLPMAAHGKVLYINLEDPPEEIARRVHEIAKHWPEETREDVARNLDIRPLMGVDFNLLYDELLEELILALAGCRLLVIDTISRAHDLDENKNSDMSRLLSRLERTARASGAAVLFLHHTSKGGALDGNEQQESSRGASALTANARLALMLIKMSEKEAPNYTYGGSIITADKAGYFVRLRTTKQNYGPIQAVRWFYRTEGGVLIPADIEDVSGAGAVSAPADPDSRFRTTDLFDMPAVLGGARGGTQHKAKPKERKKARV